MIPRKKIVIVTGSHLRSNPRVWKEANCLSEAGYEVEIYTTFFSSNYWEEDLQLIKSGIKYNPSFSLIIDIKGIVPIIFSKVLKRLANIIFLFFDISSIYQLVHSPNKQLKIIKASCADLFICHQEVGLLLGNKLLLSGHKVAFDFEDWYSEDYLHSKRPVTLLKNAEHFAMNNALFVLCPSQTMSEVLSKTYRSDKIVDVIYNCFQIEYNLKAKSHKIPNSFVWFSQVIGPDRGLENFLEAIQGLKTPIQIHLIGNSSPSFQTILLDLIKNTPHQIKFHSMVSHHQLMKMIQKFEVGLALETNCSLSRTYTLTNKILTYLQLNLNVIASDTVGQLELQFDFKESITYVSLNKYEELVEKIKLILQNKIDTKSIRFPYIYTWEAQQSKILSLVKNSIGA